MGTRPGRGEAGGGEGCVRGRRREVVREREEAGGGA